MEFIRTNWDWIASNPWVSLGFAALCFGIGWAVACLYYKERIEILKEKISGMPPSKEKIEKYSYAQHGRYGKNILVNSTSTVKAGESVSLRAEIPDGQRLHVEMEGPKRVYLADKEASWHYTDGKSINWSAQAYKNENGGFQAFDAEGGVADKELTFKRVGEVTVNVYEGESKELSWVRSFLVEEP
ncbi:hypothetical protein [Pseudoalteromonas ruthenica]|uniref:hypothetical protein n=1 Tax=Pseudoalteromonas ruthenica TaxID=151081 RepID=UPI00241C2164|nr:hypothetical protein [Pseudoalteromonas ruthenica]|tara:strand:+ start:81 stop:638 length:558 start_codon:yes stop_codon:yes gene_type:complete